MSWTTRITQSPTGELRLQFPEPLSHLDMDRQTAKHLAALIVGAADGGRLQQTPNEHRPVTAPIHLKGLCRRRLCLVYLCDYAPLGEERAANDV